MDRDRRGEVQAAVETKIIEKQKAHVAALEALEELQGLDLDAFTDLYGEGVLDGNEKNAAALLAQWQGLYEALNGDAPYVAVYGSHKELAPGCYGLGARERYELDMVVAMLDTSMPRTVEFVRSDDGTTVSAVLKGHGYLLSSKDELPTVGEPSAVTMVLVRRETGNPLGWVNNLQRVVTADDTFDLYHKIDQNIGVRYESGSPHRQVLNWLLHAPRNLERPQTVAQE